MLIAQIYDYYKATNNIIVDRKHVPKLKNKR